MNDLKGEAYESLLWHNENGIEIKPYYTGEDLKQEYEPAFTHTDWEVTVQAKNSDTTSANKDLLEKLNSGASAISIVLGNHKPEVLLNGIQLNYIHSTFYVNENNAASLKNYLEKNYNANEISFTLFPEDFASDADLKTWSGISDSFKNFTKANTCSFNALSFHNLNCFAYYEVALIMAGLVENIEEFSAKGLLSQTGLALKTGVSSDYFMQIAKLRAIRRLWKLISAEYKVDKDLYLIAETSLTNKSISDSYNNLLRTTVESMAAVSGGCNELIISPFDVLLPSNKNLPERMAVNQQLILKNESYLNTMADTACGSFYVESITDALAKKALEAFKEIEKQGGFLKCLGNGLISKTIDAQAKQKEEWIRSGKQVIIGVNKFKNEREKIGIPASKIGELREMGIHNPVLSYELEHFFSEKHA
ncbi:MAG: hypothetical protein JNL60_00970, partial [Bacteroidia bacterium]|nr:hypothetical protein [Bacteroidia bacterium]